MALDKFSATWVSHTSIRTFLECPRAFYLANVYKDPTTNHKIKIMSPPLALGQVVHEVLDQLSLLPTKERLNRSLVLRLDDVWEKITGKKGGFVNIDIEHRYKVRGQEMLRNVMDNPGPIARQAVKINKDLPYFWLSEEDNIILCGKVDWLEYISESDAVHIIDFKTGKRVQEADSLQLPIYHLLVARCQNRPVKKASYWYLEQSTKPEEVSLTDLDESETKILDIAKRIKTHRQLKKFSCPHDGCFVCEPFERVIRGEGELVGLDEYKNDAYILPTEIVEEEGSIIH